MDTTMVLSVARHCNRVLIAHEDTRTGGIGESLAALNVKPIKRTA